MPLSNWVFEQGFFSGRPQQVNIWGIYSSGVNMVCVCVFSCVMQACLSRSDKTHSGLIRISSHFMDPPRLEIQSNLDLKWRRSNKHQVLGAGRKPTVLRLELNKHFWWEPPHGLMAETASVRSVRSRPATCGPEHPKAKKDYPTWVN